MTYCTVAQARAEGASGGTELEVSESIAYAQERIDRFTGDLFAPETRTVVARIGGDGRAMLPVRLTDTDSVDLVEWLDGVEVADTLYRAYSSADQGDVDAIGVGVGHVGSNILVVGLEPWADRTIVQERVRVTGTFGWAVTPPGVVQACAILAAKIHQTRRLDNDANPSTPPPASAYDADPEGNVIPVVPPFAGDDSNDDGAADVMGARTTGYRAVDALLLPYRRLNGFTGI